MRVLLVLLAILAPLLGGASTVLACPACGDPSSGNRDFDLVGTLLLAASLLLVIRAVARPLIRRMAGPKSAIDSLSPSDETQ